jgi:hypothetical protein
MGLMIAPRFQCSICFTVTAAVAAVLWAAALTSSNGVEPDADYRRLIAELGSDDFMVRQRATAELEQAGATAIPQITAAASAQDAEVRRRALGILLLQALSPQSDLRGASREALRELEKSSTPRIAGIARGTLERVHEVTASVAAAELNHLGASVMPVPSGEPLTFNVQIRQTWAGGDERLSLLNELGEVPWLSMENSPVTDAALVHVAKLSRGTTGLTKLYLGSSAITGSNLAVLAPLTRLQYLSLKQLPLDDAKLAALPEFPELQYLGLDGTKIGDEGLKAVARYVQLQVLWLDHTPVTDAGLAHLKPLASLRTLYLPGTNTAGPGLAELRNLSNLNSLSLKGSKLSPASLKYVAQLEQLESLGLDQTNVTDDQLADLTGLSRLRILWLSSTSISDVGLEHLKSLRGLQILHLSDTQVSNEGVAELRRSLPNCQVTIVGRLEQAPAVPRIPPQRAAPPPVRRPSP